VPTFVPSGKLRCGEYAVDCIGLWVDIAWNPCVFAGPSYSRAWGRSGLRGFAARSLRGRGTNRARL